MNSLLPILALGFFLGMRHATDPDHVIAVTTLVSSHRSARSAALVGIIWGLGHTLTILVVGGGIILLGWVIPTRVGMSLELSVGVMLIVLGVLNLTGALKRITESVTPAGVPASRTNAGGLDRPAGLGVYHLVRPLIVGIVHGLAGSAAVVLLVLTTIKDPAWSVGYLVVFGVGTIVGMMLITMALAVPFTQAKQRFGRLNEGLRIASGVISVAFGLFLAYRIGVVDGLFTGTPRWTPQ
jgi:sulfite exporter TauE/SafE